MARALYYPPASTTAQWFNDNYSGSPITPNVLCWHTTETGGWPGYGGGASAPHLTYHAEDHEWRQHFRLDRSSRALRNAAGGVETNTLNACQVEIIAYSDEALAHARGHLPVSELDARALRDLGDFAAFMWDEWGLKLDIDPGWVRSDYVTSPPMSNSEWRGFYGHTGHNRVPENTHWDPARLDIDTIIAHAKQEDDMPSPKDWDSDDWNLIRSYIFNTNLERGEGSPASVQMSKWASDQWPDHLATDVDTLLGYIAVYSRGGLIGVKDLTADIAAIRSEQAANRELLVQLAAQQSGVTLNDEQVSQIAQHIADAGQGACDQVLERLTVAGEALADDTDA